MNIKEATQKGICRLRRPMWVPDECYIKIDLIAGGYGPWGHLFSRKEQAMIGEPTPQNFLVIGDATDDYEPYQGELDNADV